MHVSNAFVANNSGLKRVISPQKKTHNKTAWSRTNDQISKTKLSILERNGLQKFKTFVNSQRRRVIL